MSYRHIKKKEKRAFLYIQNTERYNVTDILKVGDNHPHQSIQL